MEHKKSKPQKPVAAKAKNNSHATADPLRQVQPDELAKLAYDIFQRRGAGHGHDLEDWLMAEQMLQSTRKIGKRS